MTSTGNLDRLAQHGKSLESSLYHVVRVSGAQRLGQNVRYTCAFQHSTHGTTGDHTRTMSSRLDEHLRSAFLGQLIVGDRTMHHRNLDQILLRIFDTLGNGFLDFLSLAQTMTDNTALIADYNQCREAECPAAFCCFNNTI